MGPNVSLVTFAGEGHGQILSSIVRDRRRGIGHPRPAASGAGHDVRARSAGRPADVLGRACPCRKASGRSSTIRRSTSPSGCRRPRSTPTCGTWRVTRRPSSAAYQAGFGELGFEVTDAPELLEGATSLVAFAPDGTRVVILIIPADVLASNPDLEAAAELALPGQGFVIVAALGELVVMPPAGSVARAVEPGSDTGRPDGSTPVWAATASHRSARRPVRPPGVEPIDRDHPVDHVGEDGHPRAAREGARRRRHPGRGVAPCDRDRRAAAACGRWGQPARTAAPPRRVPVPPQRIGRWWRQAAPPLLGAAVALACRHHDEGV